MAGPSPTPGTGGTAPLAFPGVAVDLPVWGEAMLAVAASLSILFALIRLRRNRRR
ncbi:hypothetical protein [Streptomyces sp. NPDC029526]|uniref:hypothetical protein n=1 Tax=Streptomyces sp. NPDC029526 TaxID=3155728 RepID=UPI0033EF2120